MFSIKNMLLVVLWLTILTVKAQDSTCTNNACDCSSRPDFHAPIGVMLDHGHDKGQWMVSYRYMNMSMQGNLSGSSAISNSAILTDYIMAPEKMTMQMHMLMLMYGITNKITVMGMANYVDNSMSMSMTMYGMMNMQGMNMSHMSMESLNSTMTMKDHSQGFSDTKIYVLYKLLERKNHELLISNGLNIPAGNISLHGNNMGYDARKTYGMQLGSGTYAWLPGLTYTGNSPHISWGIQATGIINAGVNANGYSYGNSATFTSWLSYKWNNWISSSIRAEGTTTGKIYGFDKEISPYRTTDPMANSKNYGGQRVGAFAGLNFLIPKGKLKGNQFSVEYGLPLYQNVNGIQMKTIQTINAGWQFSF
jgi:hypothetical protein